MNIELMSKEDFLALKTEIIAEVSRLIKLEPECAGWFKSKQVRKMLNCSASTLQNLRINGTLPYTKVGGTIYYAEADVRLMMEKNKRNEIKSVGGF